MFGRYSLADIFYTPVAARVIGYNLPISASARARAELLLSIPEIRQWRKEGLAVTYDPMPHDLALPHLPWPVEA